MNRFYQILLIALVSCLPSLFWAQTSTYTVSFSANAGNPLGLNTDADASTAGWTAIHAGTLSANAWSPAQTIPFAFQFYGSPVTQYKVSANGLLTFS